MAHLVHDGGFLLQAHEHALGELQAACRLLLICSGVRHLLVRENGVLQKGFTAESKSMRHLPNAMRTFTAIGVARHVARYTRPNEPLPMRR